MVRSVLLSVVLLAGCGGNADVLPPVPEPTGCEPPARALPDGRCIRPGNPPDGCGEGFVHDGEYVCEPVLPDEACPAGEMAVPGEPACREVMACPPGRYGDIPTDATIEHVDLSYAGSDSDGSADRPWTTIAEAIMAAAAGAIVAVAPGSYAEDVTIAGQPVRLWGKCPGEVEIAGTGAAPAAVMVREVDDGVELRGLALTGPAAGIAISGARGVLVDRVWVHETAGRGIGVESTLGPTEVTVAGSLVEQCTALGVFVMGGEVTIEASVVRGTALTSPPGEAYGFGVLAQPLCDAKDCDPDTRAKAAVRGSLFEDNHEVGLLVMSSDATIDGTVVRRTGARADGTAGMGLTLQPLCGAAGCNPASRAQAVISRSLVADNRDAGLLVLGSDATIESTTVRGTLTRASDQEGGRGIVVQAPCLGAAACGEAVAATAVVRTSVVESNREIGLFVSGASATIEDTVVRGTLPPPSDQLRGYGVAAQQLCPGGAKACIAGARASAEISRALVENNHEVGILLGGADGTITDSIVRATLPRAADQLAGRGIGVQAVCDGSGCDPTTASTATIRGSLVEDNREIGLFVQGSQATIESTTVRATTPHETDGRFGDGVAVLSRVGLPAAATLTGVRIADSARAGIATFGAAVSIGGTRITCAAFDLDGEPAEEQDFSIAVTGQNHCGCPDPVGECVAASAGLEAPGAASQ